MKEESVSNSYEAAQCCPKHWVCMMLYDPIFHSSLKNKHEVLKATRDQFESQNQLRSEIKKYKQSTAYEISTGAPG